MDQRADYLLQILENIGAPLMRAITDHTPGDGTVDAQEDARFMAALLGKTVEASIDLGNIMEINPAEAQDDSLRVALAGLSGPLVAGQFAKRGKVPESPDIKRMTGALQAVLTFSDNFTPTPEALERLKNLESEGQNVDAYQTQIQYMQALIPVVEAIAAFPFGQAEPKLIMEVSERLVQKAVELREALLPGVSDESVQKRAELGLLKALTSLYSACHKAETQKVMQMDAEAQSGNLSMDPVWQGFDTRAAMLETLATNLLPAQNAQGTASGNVSPATTQPEQAPAKPPVTSTPTPAPETQAQPSVAEQPPASPPPTAPVENTANPMAMFANKPKTEESAPQSQGTIAPDTPVEPAAPVQPPAQPTEQQATPPTQPPPAEENRTDEGDNSDNAGSGGGNPMSFFKKSE